MRRFIGVVMILVLQVCLLAVHGRAATAFTQMTARASTYGELTEGYKCKKGSVSNGNQYYKCANITWRRANISMNGPISVRVRNRTSVRQNFTCKWEEEKTWTFSVNVSSEIEAGVIFAKATVTISGGVSRAKSVTTGTSVDITVRPRTVAWCRSGIAMPEFGGQVKTLKCAWTGACAWTSSKSYSARVPKQLVWDIVDRPL